MEERSHRHRDCRIFQGTVETFFVFYGADYSFEGAPKAAPEGRAFVDWENKGFIWDNGEQEIAYL